jgi:hypothetical protein
MLTNPPRVETPAPGSDDALACGCTCPIVLNRHGEGIGQVGAEPCFWYWLDHRCLVHGHLTGQPAAARLDHYIARPLY